MQVGAPPLVSIVIATYNREEPLCRTLRCWLEQQGTNHEIIVVDQSERHDAATQAFLDSVSGTIRYLLVDHPNLPAARNFGVKQSKGDIVLFCDDDMEVPSDVVTKIANHYSDLTIAGVTGVVFDAALEPEPSPQAVVVATRTFAGGFMSFRREVIEAAGYFDEWLGSLPHGAGEDFEFTYRVSNLGFKLIRDRNIVIRHLGHTLSGGCERAVMRKYVAKPETNEADMFAGMYAYWKNRKNGIAGWAKAFWLSYHGYVLNYELIARHFNGGWKRHVRFWRVSRRLLKKPWSREHA